jgi:RNA polymerase sigma-70 factor (ECF subfamily)
MPLTSRERATGLPRGFIVGLKEDMVQSTSPAQPTDIDLVRAFQAGSVEAFDQIFVRYHQAIVGLTTRLVRNPLLAEDLTQETFFRVLRSLERIDDSFNFSAWIHRIATNLCYDELRRQKRTRPPASEDGIRAASQPLIGVEDPDELLRTVAADDPRGHPEDALAMRELRREVWDVAAKLPDNYRMVLSLRELQGLSYNGIAKVMSLSESAVETLLHRARRRFKAEYMYQTFEEAKDEEGHEALQDLLSTFQVRSLQRRQRAVVKQHLERCARCREFALKTAGPVAAGDDV